MKENFTHDTIDTVAKKVLLECKTKDACATVVALKGDLGAGKTTLVQAVGKQLGITMPMLSPTFVIMKRYPISHPTYTSLIHIDAYRLEDPKEAATFRWNDILQDSTNLVFVEWPERIRGVLPKNLLVVTLEHVDDTTRSFCIEKVL